MSQYVETPTRTFQVNAALTQYVRVKLSSGKLVVATPRDVELGTLEREALAADEWHAVRLRTATGTAKFVAGAAISVGDVVYGAASGKILKDANGNPIGIALEAASGDNSVIEVLRQEVPSRNLVTANVETLSATKVLAVGAARTQALDPGGAGREVTLPVAAGGLSGLDFLIENTADAAEVLTIKDGGATICTPTQNENAYVWCEGSAWRGTVGASV